MILLMPAAMPFVALFAFGEGSDEWLELGEGIFSFCSGLTWTH